MQRRITDEVNISDKHQSCMSIMDLIHKAGLEKTISNVGDENNDILDILTNLQGSMLARENIFDEGDGFNDEFLEDVDEMDTSNNF